MKQYNVYGPTTLNRRILSIFQKSRDFFITGLLVDLQVQIVIAFTNNPSITTAKTIATNPFKQNIESFLLF
jgi:hypothetical protein